MKKKKFKKIVLRISIILIIAISSFLLYFCYLFNSYTLNKDQLTNLNNGIKVFSSNTNETTLYNTNRSLVEIESLPGYVLDAFVNTEDKRFYKHKGYDIKRIFKAIIVNIFSQNKSQGASTISQQLIKNSLLTNEKTYSRKLKELVLSIKMEKEFSKDEILEMYLNTIYFGSNAYGIENASKIYFDKSAKELSLNEACCLAGIIKSPNYYSPKTNYEKSLNRKNLVAKLMLNENSISQSEYEEVANSPIELKSNKINSSYEQEAIFEACDLLNLTERELINRKYSIKTYKDDKLQDEVFNINNSNLQEAETQTNSSLDSLSVVTDNDGHILSFYSNSNYSLHNLKRQPASTLKPFAVYLPCLIHNILSPSSEILDEKINYNGFCPENADKKYNGYVTAKYALANSLNIPAVKALDNVGIKKSKEILNKLGFELNNSDMNLSIALGSISKGIKILDLLNAYLTIANLGECKHLTFIDKIYNENGDMIYSNEKYSDKLFEKEDCYLLTSMLKDAATTGTAKRLNSLNLPLASKTGTASVDGKNTDLYNVTYSTQHTILSWAASIKDKYLPSSLHSSGLTTNINKAICEYLYKNKKPDDFVIPKGIIYSAFDANEQMYNHRIVAPKSQLERYKKYDYFKLTNLPQPLNYTEDVKLEITLSNIGATIKIFNLSNNNYKLYRKINGIEELFLETKVRNETIVDKSIFKHDKIEYYIKDEKNNIVSNIVEIKPKEYLFKRIENETFLGKKSPV